VPHRVVLPGLDPNGPPRRKPVQCRPRPSAADRDRQRRQSEMCVPDERQASVFDPTATRFAKDATEAQIIKYYRRRRHLFGWPAHRNAPTT
jgi:hypothetical protein